MLIICYKTYILYIIIRIVQVVKYKLSIFTNSFMINIANIKYKKTYSKNLLYVFYTTTNTLDKFNSPASVLAIISSNSAPSSFSFTK